MVAYIVWANLDPNRGARLLPNVFLGFSLFSAFPLSVKMAE